METDSDMELPFTMQQLVENTHEAEISGEGGGEGSSRSSVGDWSLFALNAETPLEEISAASSKVASTHEAVANDDGRRDGSIHGSPSERSLSALSK